jgi:hypothetical protein
MSGQYPTGYSRTLMLLPRTDGPWACRRVWWQPAGSPHHTKEPGKRSSAAAWWASSTLDLPTSLHSGHSAPFDRTVRELVQTWAELMAQIHSGTNGVPAWAGRARAGPVADN